MSSREEGEVPARLQPHPEDYAYDLDTALNAVVALRAVVPVDAFTAETLGTERSGHGVLIRPGLVLTIGYLITEAETLWVRLADGRVFEGHPLGYDQTTGFGLVQLLAHIDTPVLPIGSAASVAVGDPVVIAGAGGLNHSVAARIISKQEFAGYWEYVLDEALFIAPAHPHWGGTAVIGPQGELVGIGSLQLERERARGRPEPLNMAVPIDLLPPILDDLMTRGRPNRPPRPWLGVYATEADDRVVVIGVASGGPAQQADLRTGDVLIAVAGTPVADLAELFRRIWALGEAGVPVPLKVWRDGRTFDVTVASSDRSRFLKGPRLH